MDTDRASRVETFRQALPEAAARVTQLTVDNPAQVALMFAGGLVLGRAALNIVKPRTPLEALAVFAVVQVAFPHLALAAVERGWLKFRVRDAEGQLVPAIIRGKADA